MLDDLEVSSRVVWSSTTEEERGGRFSVPRRSLSELVIILIIETRLIEGGWMTLYLPLVAAAAAALGFISKYIITTSFHLYDII